MANSWEYVSAKLGNIKPETKAKAEEIFFAARKAGHEIWYMWGMGSSAEHKTGRALDLMVRNAAAGDWVRNYIWANRSRLRLQHVIWEQHITSTVTQPGVRRKMADRGNTTENHYDHNHVLFLTGAYVGPGGSPNPPNPPKPVPPKKPTPPRPPTPTKKSNETIAKEVIDGKWANGNARQTKLRQAGYNPSVIQALVNKMLKGGPVGKKSLATLVQEVKAGKWGNGSERRTRLTAAGYKYDVVQAEVNKSLR